MSINHSNYKKVAPFRAFCQKVLPLVYDDSLSYYELLCKLLNQVNLLTENLNTNIDDINQLYNYVNNYFNNLDVQDEINNKLDQMASDGTLENIIDQQLFQGLKKASVIQDNKSFVFFGDSLVLGQTQTGLADPTFPETFGEIVKAVSISNQGIGGTTYSNSTKIPENMRTNAFVNRMRSFNFTPYDTIFIMYGTNDYGYEVPLGQEFDEDSTTFYGALNISIKYMFENYGNKEIYILIPPYANTYETKNNLGYTMLSYMNAIKNRCSYYGVPVYDFGALLGVNQYNAGTMYWDNALHPTQETYDKMGTFLAKAYTYQNGLIGKNDLSYVMPTVSPSNMLAYNDFEPTGLHPFTNKYLEHGVTLKCDPSLEANGFDTKRRFYIEADQWYTVSFSVKATQPNQLLQWSFYELSQNFNAYCFPEVGENRYNFTVKANATGYSLFQIAWEKSNTDILYVSDICVTKGKTPISNTVSTRNTFGVYPITLTNDHAETDAEANTKLGVLFDPQGMRGYFSGNLRLLQNISDTKLFTLPWALRPGNTQYVPVLTESNGEIKTNWLSISVNGDVAWVGTVTMTGEKMNVFIDGVGWNIGLHEIVGTPEPTLV